MTEDQARRDGEIAGSLYALRLTLRDPETIELFVSELDARAYYSTRFLELGRAAARVTPEKFGKRDSKKRDDLFETFARGFQSGARKEMYDEAKRRGIET